MLLAQLLFEVHGASPERVGAKVCRPADVDRAVGEGDRIDNQEVVLRGGSRREDLLPMLITPFVFEI